MIGGAIGMILAWSPILAVTLAAVGALLGHLIVDRETTAPRVEAPPSEEELLGGRRSERRGSPLPAPTGRGSSSSRDEQKLLADLLCPIFIEVARADSGVVQPEIRVVREFFQHTLGFDDAGMELVRLALKDALAASEQDMEHLVKRARTEIKPSLRITVVRALYDMGLADAELSTRERDLLKHVTGNFNLSDEQLQQITTQYFGGGDAHYATLGLTAAATDEELKSAFRKLAAEHHPDRATALGPKEAEAAAERFRKVKDAWEALRKIRGN
ncbi:MAG: TerB family tellurite resistance protein [Myxococcales bacterium]|nr:TerB family tellurite resistance protein [Myxococcales bacterium]